MSEVYQTNLLENLGVSEDQYTLSPQDFRARLFQLLDTEKASTMHEVLYSLKSQGSHLYSDLNIYSLKTLTDCVVTTKGEHSQQSSIFWGNLIMMSKHRLLTLRTGESLRTANGYISCALTEILEPNPDPKYFLSEEATKKLLSKLSEEAKDNEAPKNPSLNKDGTVTAIDAHYYKGIGFRGNKMRAVAIDEVRPCLTPGRPEKQQNGRRFKEPGGGDVHLDSTGYTRGSDKG